MNVSIRKAELFDINGFLKLDKHIAPERLKTVISADRAFVLGNFWRAALQPVLGKSSLFRPDFY